MATVVQRAGAIQNSMVTTAFELPGHPVVRSLGLVRGITVRSRNAFATIGGGLQSLLGGNISLFTELAEQARKEAYDLMVSQAW